MSGKLFALSVFSAGFMGLVAVSLSTAYAFAEFFGVSGSLDDSFKKSKAFYFLYIPQLLVATTIIIFSNISFFQVALVTQIINAVALPLVFYFLIKLTGDNTLMSELANNRFQRWFAIVCTIVIVVMSAFTVGSMFFT